MQQFARQAVAHVHHRGGADAQFTHLFKDITAGFGFELALDDVFLAGEIRLEFTVFHSLADTALTLQQLQAHIGSSQIAADADQVGIFRAAAVNDVFAGGFAQTGHADDQSGHRCAGVAADQIHTVSLTGDAHSLV